METFTTKTSAGVAGEQPAAAPTIERKGEVILVVAKDAVGRVAVARAAAAAPARRR